MTINSVGSYFSTLGFGTPTAAHSTGSTNTLSAAKLSQLNREDLVSLIMTLMGRGDFASTSVSSASSLDRYPAITQTTTVNDAGASTSVSASLPVSGTQTSFSTSGVSASSTVQAAQTELAKLGQWCDKYDLNEITALNKGADVVPRMQYLYKKVHGWTVTKQGGNWVISQDDRLFGDKSKNYKGTNVNDASMKLSNLVQREGRYNIDNPDASPNASGRTGTWNRPELENFYGYKATRPATFNTLDTLINGNNLNWHNGSFTLFEITKLKKDLESAEGTLSKLQSEYSTTCDPSTKALIDQLCAKVENLKCVGKGLFEMSEKQSTPYIVDFKGDGIATGDQFVNVGDQSIQWVKANQNTDDAFLFFDKNGNGQLDGLQELVSARKEDAAQGQSALADLDDNGDGKVDKNDKAFGKLHLFFDKNADAVVDQGELASLASHQVQSFNVAYEANHDDSNSTGFKTDANGNTHRYTTLVNTLDGQGQEKAVKMTDVFFGQLS